MVRSIAARGTLYTGKLDELFDYRFGELEYRSLRFESETLRGEFQRTAIVNYSERQVPFTRIVEHKHFEHKSSPLTVITREYPAPHRRDSVPFYPVRDAVNTALFERYQSEARRGGLLFGGRLAEYRYYDMHQAIGSALKLAREEFTVPARHSPSRLKCGAPLDIFFPNRELMPESRRNLIVCPVGDDSVHASWLSGPETPNFDLFLVYYGEHSEREFPEAKFLLRQRGFKFELLDFAINERRDVFDGYDSIWCPDDDLRLDMRGVNRLFELFAEYRLQLAQPAIAKGDASFQTFVRQPANVLRFTPYVETMCPIFTRRSFLRVSATFIDSRSGWGLDLVWPRFFQPKEMAILDEVGVEHTRPLEIGSLYKKLAALGIDPRREMQAVAARYGRFDPRQHHRLFRGNLKLPAIRRVA